MDAHSKRSNSSRHAGAIARTLAALLTLGALVSIVVGVLFFLFAAAVNAGWTQPIDEAVLGWIAARRTPRLDALMLETTALGNALVSVVLVGIAILFLWLTRHRWSVLLLAVAALGGTLINNGLKYAIDRPRPDIVEALTGVATPSFPSGHAMNAFIMYASVAYVVGRLEPSRRLRLATWLVAAALIAGVGASRVYLGVHYPSDVLAGFLGGAAWLAFIAGAIAALERYEPSR
jgi:undecaprenyl-diphosphatase